MSFANGFYIATEMSCKKTTCNILYTKIKIKLKTTVSKRKEIIKRDVRLLNYKVTYYILLYIWYGIRYDLLKFLTEKERII